MHPNGGDEEKEDGDGLEGGEERRALVTTVTSSGQSGATYTQRKPQGEIGWTNGG